jgi:hypothetical protein
VKSRQGVSTTDRVVNNVRGRGPICLADQKLFDFAGDTALELGI